MNPRRFTVLLALALVASGAAFVTHLVLRFRNVEIGYQVQSARERARQLRLRANVIQLELASRRSPAELVEIGRAQLGMVEGDRVTTLVVGGALRPARPSGRAR